MADITKITLPNGQSYDIKDASAMPAPASSGTAGDVLASNGDGTGTWKTPSWMSEPYLEGTDGQVLTTDGNGTRSWTTVVAVESDPVFTASAASGITSNDVTNWNGKLDAPAQAGQVGDVLVTSDNNVIEWRTPSWMNEPNVEGTNGQVLTTDGNGGRSWETVSGGSVASVNGRTGAVVVSRASTAAIPTTGWTQSGTVYTQDITCSNVTATATLIVGPAPAYIDPWVTANLRATAQAASTITFTCDSVPTEAGTANILIEEVTT